MFKNLQELITRLPDDKTCRKYLEQQRWQNGITCPYCGHNKCYIIENGERYKCASKTCFKRFTVTVGTIFHASNIPLQKWFIAVYLNTAHKKGISSCQLAKDISVTQKSAWFMLMRIREGVRAKAPIQLKNQVQMDESYFGGEWKNKHAKARKEMTAKETSDKAPVFGMLETDGKVVVQSVKWVTKQNAENLMIKHIDKDATLVTDAYNMYQKIGAKHFKKHISINHQNNEFVFDGYHVNGLENYWSVLKRSIYGIYHHVSRKHLQRYCDESAYRFNSRKIRDNERFTITLQNLEGKFPYKVLVNNSLTLIGGKEINQIETGED